MRKAVSAGGVVLRKINSRTEILLAFSNFSKGWVLPKGHVDKGETIEETAVREVREETGLSDFKLVSKLGVITRPSKEYSGEIVEKDIHVFVFKTFSNINPTPENEHEKTKWFELFEGINKIRFKPDRDFLMNKIKELEKF